MEPIDQARALRAEGRLHDALQAAQAVCEQAPKDPEAWGLLALISGELGLAAASEDAARRARTLRAGRPKTPS